MTNKFELFNYIINYKQYTSYLELGVGQACDTIKNIKCPHIESVDVVSFTTQYPSFVGTTDEYFDNASDPKDFIFIDAAHDAKTVLRDFKKSVELLKDDGIIAIHDIAPWDEQQTSENVSGTAYIAYMQILADERYDSVCVKFDNDIQYPDVVALVKIRKNKNKLNSLELNFNYYLANKLNIIQFVENENLERFIR
jgi:hypothetical protein